MSTEDFSREMRDPSTTAERLQQIAQADHATWAMIAAHPAAYPGLLDWLGEHGDDAVRDAIAQRGSTPPPPPPPPAATSAPAPTPPADQPAPVAEVPPEPTVVIPASEASTTEQPAIPVAAAPLNAPESAAPVAASNGSATTNNSTRLVAAVAVIAALAVGGYFGIQALTGDDDSPVAASSDSGDTDDSGDSEDSEDSGDSGDSGDFCDTMQELQDVSVGALDDQGKADATIDPDALNDTLKKQSDLYVKIGENAPAEIKEDAAYLSEVMSKLSDVDSYADGESPFATGDSSKYLESAQAVQAYYYKNCV